MAEANLTNPNQAKTGAPPPSRNKRILCAEDDQHTNDLLNFWLAQNGYDVKTVDTKTDALSWARREQFDLYLLNDWLPDGRGKDLLIMIHDFDLKTPIVFFSLNVQAANQGEILRLGAQAFISKPTDWDKITDVLQQLLPVPGEEQKNLSP